MFILFSLGMERVTHAAYGAQCRACRMVAA